MDLRSRVEHALGTAYSVDRELSGGGMSHVYVAEERAFGRQVVVKVLREDLTEGASAERFKREIAVVAKLQHPHIVPLLTAGDDGGTLYYTMPFVDGESLRDRLTREGELPVNDVVRVMREIASALAYAHRRGIIHRDVKPENVLFSDGSAVVTDFGIAKALEIARTVGDARASTITQLGVALGTPAYMAPEQAAADPSTDHRADLYALGCVGYELLSGRPPFDGRVPRQLLAAHATETPAPIAVRRAHTPPALAALVMQCLEKSAADRPQTAEEILRALDGPVITPVGTPLDGSAPNVARTGGSRTRRIVVACALVGAGVVAGAIAAVSLAGAEARLASYDVGLSDDAPIVFRGALSLAIAPAGEFVVYVSQMPSGVSHLRYRSLRDTVERVISGTDGGFDPQVSPDGRSVAFVRLLQTAEGRTGSRLEITSVEGGQSRPLADLRQPVGIRWVSPSRFFVVDDDGNTIRWFDPQSGEIGSAAPISRCLAPAPFDDTQSVLCSDPRKRGKVALLTEFTARLLQRHNRDSSAGAGNLVGTHFRVVDGRYIVFLSIDGELRAARFDRATLQVGRPVTFVSGIRREAYQNVGQYDIAPNGTLIYALGENAEVGRMMIVHPRSSAPEPVPLLAEAAAYLRFGLTADGRRFASVVQARDGQELRVYDLPEGRSRTWLKASQVGHLLWSPGGDRIATLLTQDSTWVLVAGSPDVADGLDTLARDSENRLAPNPSSWRLDSLMLAAGNRTVLAFDPRTRNGTVDTVLGDAIFPELSPDGRFLLFTRLSTGNVLITPYPGRTSLSRVTEAQGVEAEWASMTTVRYRSTQGSSWFEVTVDSATGRVRGAPRPYFSDPRFVDTPGWSQRAVSNGGMIYVQGPARTTATYVRVVPNWVARMKHAVDSVDGSGAR
jgi:serine/threonine-protein kinase